MNPITGNVMFQAYTETLRVTFDDAVAPPAATWASVESLQTSVTNNDPILFTDKATGRTWAGGLNGQCSVLAMTDDDGQSWLPVGNSCASPAFDHETIGSGPWRGAKPAQATYDRAFYYCAHTTVQQCSLSYDGGLTFTPGVVINPGLQCFGLHGHVKVASDGFAYVPSRNCIDGAGHDRAGVTVTGNNGLTWYTRLVPGSDRSADGFDPSVATTASGWVYLAWEGANGRPHVSLSKNHGFAWTAPVDVAAGSGIVTATFLAAVAGDDDRVAVAYLATRDEGDPYAESFQGTWDLYVSMSLDQGATWTTTRVTQDPVQRGWICAMGVGCPLGSDGSQPGRNLLDFIDATLDAEGRLLVAFADGCVDACAVSGTPEDSRDQRATIARQSGGPCLVAGGCGAASGTPVPPPFDDQCDSNVVIFSSHSAGTPAVNPHALACIASPANPGVSTAYLNPGSDRVSVRFTEDLGANVTTLTGVLDGLGLSQHAVTLTRSALSTGGFVYNSERVPIDPTLRGEITAIVLYEGAELDRVTFHTA